MKLIFEGNPDEIKMFLGIDVHEPRVDSVQPVISAAALLEDRLIGSPSRESAGTLEEKLECPPGLKGLGSVDSVHKAPKILDSRTDRKEDVAEELVRKASEITADSVSRLPGPAAWRRDRIQKSDLLIPRFSYDQKLEKWYKKIAFVELDDGRIVLSYLGQHFYTNREIISQLPKPLPPGYLTHSGLSPNANTAFRAYCEYLSVQVPNAMPELATDRKRSVDSVPPEISAVEIREDRKESDDPDWMFRAQLGGAINTHCDYDGSKLEEVM